MCIEHFCFKIIHLTIPVNNIFLKQSDIVSFYRNLNSSIVHWIKFHMKENCWIIKDYFSSVSIHY